MIVSGMEPLESLVNAFDANSLDILVCFLLVLLQNNINPSLVNLSRGMASFFISMLSFVWRAGSTADYDDSKKLTQKQALGPRIANYNCFRAGDCEFV
jgi:hypothetical protein